MVGGKLSLNNSQRKFQKSGGERAIEWQCEHIEHKWKFGH
jgi:hypothetical protein